MDRVGETADGRDVGVLMTTAALSLALIALLGGAPTAGAGINRCARADVALFRARAHDRIAIRVSGVDPGQPVEFDGPGFHRVRHANRRGQAVVRVRPRRGGRAGVTVQCNDHFSVRVREIED
jgi:hypothetical protein